MTYSALSIVTPPASEPVDLPTVKRHCRIDHDDDDVLLAGYLATARSMAEDFLGRVLITQTLRWTMVENAPMGALPLLPMPLMVLPVVLSFPQIWNKPFDLPRSPVQSVTSVKIVDGDGVESTLDPLTEYSVDLGLDPSRLRLNRLTYPIMVRSVAIEFVAGYGATRAAVPPRIVTAILMTVAWLYETRGDQGADMPTGIQSMLWPNRIMTFG